MLTAVLVTSNVTRMYPFQVLRSAAQRGLSRDSKARVEQVRSVAAVRLGAVSACYRPTCWPSSTEHCGYTSAYELRQAGLDDEAVAPGDNVGCSGDGFTAWCPSTWGRAGLRWRRLCTGCVRSPHCLPPVCRAAVGSTALHRGKSYSQRNDSFGWLSGDTRT